MTDRQNSIADDLLRNGYERWERLEGEKAAIGDDLKELFSELKSAGFTPKALRESFRRVRNIADADQQEHDAVVDLYVASLTGARPAPAPAHVDDDDAEVKARIAALKANPALAVVDVANLKKSEPQPAPQAGSDLTTLPCASGQVADIQPETATTVPSIEGVKAPMMVAADANTGGKDDVATNLSATVETLDDRADDQPLGSDVEVVAPIAYPPPGEVYWENTPREPVHRHKYSEAFGSLGSDAYVIDEDISKAQSAAIVMIGDTILDGWARYLCARNTIGLHGGSADYPVYQYDGTDPLLDCIRWNVEGRILNDDQLRIIAKRLVTLEPKRKADIFKVMGFGMELVA